MDSDQQECEHKWKVILINLPMIKYKCVKCGAYKKEVS